MISACYIVKDEMLNLPWSIYHTKDMVDEICIVDTGSTDGTKEYARSVADKYLDFKWCDDFSKARNTSLDLAEDWILVLDADEFIDAKYKNRLRNLCNGGISAYKFTVQAFMHDPRWIPSPHVIYGKSIRLFKKGYKYKYLVHNELECEEWAETDIPIHNFEFMDRFKIDEKTAQNKRLMKKKIKQMGLTAVNAINYADIFRKLYHWKHRERDLRTAIYFLKQSLRLENRLDIRQVYFQLLQELERVKSIKQKKAI